MPPFVIGIRNFIDAAASWALYLVPGIIIITLIIGGIALSKADDAMETKAVKEKMQRVIVGAALAGGSTWLGNFIWSLF